MRLYHLETMAFNRLELANLGGVLHSLVEARGVDQVFRSLNDGIEHTVTLEHLVLTLYHGFHLVSRYENELFIQHIGARWFDK